MGVLLEGVFSSCYENRLDQSMNDAMKSIKMEFKPKSESTKMIVVSDGDIIRNYYDESTDKFTSLGYNRWEKITYNGNREFILNALEYLTNQENILEARSKQFRIRLLDQVKIENEKSFWQWLNIGLPVFGLILFGITNAYLRKKRYTKKL